MSFVANTDIDCLVICPHRSDPFLLTVTLPSYRLMIEVSVAHPTSQDKMLSQDRHQFPISVNLTSFIVKT